MKNNTITYRSATSADKTALDACLQEIIAAERPMDTSLKEGHIQYYDPLSFVENPHAELIVGLDKGNIIACGAAEIRQAKDYYRYERLLYLAMMFVAKDYRGQGINADIMKRLLDWGKARHVTNASLTVYPSNESAIKAYEKLGFESALIEMRLSMK